MRVVTFIPARYGSTRFPGKPLAMIAGKPMIQWVYDAAVRAPGVDDVVVATDDIRIEETVKGFGGTAVMTDSGLASGSDRVAEALKFHSADIIVNLQGDEPLMPPSVLSSVVNLVRSGRFEMASLMTPFTNREEIQNPNIVKVIVDRKDRAIYFSRFPIPYSRSEASGAGFACYQHIGVYVYTRATLERFRSLPPSPLEKSEQLEQLRAIENGIAIGMARGEFTSVSVDTPEDLEKARRVLNGN